MFPNFPPPTAVVVVIAMAEHLKHLWVICCVFVSEKPKRIDFFAFLCKIDSEKKRPLNRYFVKLNFKKKIYIYIYIEENHLIN